MNLVEVLLGIGLVVASALAFKMVLPRDGKVRPFLRGEHAQAYLTVFILGAAAMGFANIITGLVP